MPSFAERALESAPKRVTPEQVAALVEADHSKKVQQAERAARQKRAQERRDREARERQANLAKSKAGPVIAAMHAAAKAAEKEQER